MWVAEMDCAPVPQVANVVQQMVNLGDVGYPGKTQLQRASAHTEADYTQLPSYEQAYVTFAKERWNLTVDESNIRIMPDVMQGIAHAIQALGIRALAITTPVYPYFRTYARNAGCALVEANMTNTGALDFEELERAFQQADGFLLCNPHNPSGVVPTTDELTRVFQLAHHYNVHVIVDEIHAPLTSPQAARAAGTDPFVPALSVPGSERALVLFSAAKAFNLAGLKAALMIGGPDAHPIMDVIPAEVSQSAGTVALAAHTAALTYGGQWLDTVRHTIDLRRNHLHTTLQHLLPEATVTPAQATYFAWIHMADVQGPQGIPLGSNPAEFLLHNAHIAVNPGHTFGAGGEGYVRMNLATSAEVLDTALQRIHDALTKK